MLEKNHTVLIYQKPITDEKLEGEAKLIKHEFNTDDGYQYWQVQFPGENETYGRMVHPRHLTS